MDQMTAQARPTPPVPTTISEEARRVLAAGAVSGSRELPAADNLNGCTRSTVHVLCNNATGGGGGPFCEPIDVAVWETAMAATVYSVLHGLNAFLPRMLAQEEGHIVNTASRQGLVRSPILGAYPPAKASVIALSEMLHAELAERGAPVGVTVLTPGGVSTEGILGSLAMHESVAFRDRPRGLP